MLTTIVLQERASSDVLYREALYFISASRCKALLVQTHIFLKFSNILIKKVAH